MRKIEKIFISDSKSQTRMRELSKVVYAPLKPSLDKYQTLESMKLLSDLSESTRKDILDELRFISMSVPKLVTSFGEASERCLKLTEGCLYPALICSLEECLGKYLDRFTNLVCTFFLLIRNSNLQKK